MTATPSLIPVTKVENPTSLHLISPLPSSIFDQKSKADHIITEKFLESQLFSQSLPLPYLVFSNDLKLVSINKVGAGLFEGEENNLGRNLDYFLCEEQIINDGPNSESLVLKSLRKKLERYSNHTQASSTRRWFEGLVLDYWTGSTNSRHHFRAEVIISSISLLQSTVLSPTGLLTPPDTPFLSTTLSSKPYYSILFVRDVDIPVSVQNAPITTCSSCSLPYLSRRDSTSSPVVPLGVIAPNVSIPINLLPSSDQTTLIDHHLEQLSVSQLVPELIPPVVIDQPSSRKNDIAYYFDPLVPAPTEHEYKVILDHLPHIAFTTNESGIVQYFNEFWYDFTGIPHGTGLDTQVWITYFHSDDMVDAIPKWQNSLSTGDSFTHEYRIRAADGSWKWHAARSIGLRDASGALYIWISTIVEIQELILSRNEALRIQKSVAAVLLGADIVLLSVDRSSVVTLFEGSASAAVAVGIGSIYPDSSCIGQSLSTIWADERLGLAVSKILSQNLDAASWLLEAEGVEEGKHCYRYRLVPLIGTSDDDLGVVTGVTIVVADVTQLVTSEQQLQASRIAQQSAMASEQAANEASRLKTEFVTNISHEIRTPIAAMIGICEILLDDLSLTETQRGLVEKSLRSGENLLDLVGMVLDMGKLVEAGKLKIEKKPFLFADVLDDAALFSVPTSRKGLKFVSDIGPHYIGVLEGDRVRIRQVLANVLSNSIKFTKNGSITLAVKQISESETQCVFEFTIRDTGIGIQEHILPTLFVPFQQADTSTAREYGGTGLGLAISRNLVELMGGTLELESIATLGTKMMIVIPVLKSNVTVSEFLGNPSSSTSTSLLSDVPYASLEGAKILVAEDNELILDIVTRILRKKKFNVTGVCDGLEAVKAVKEGDFDLVLMDGQMPKLDGYAAAGAIRLLDDPKKRNIKIIALTASAFKGDMERCLDAGMDGYLSKPVRAKDLEAAIWDHLRGPSSSVKLSS